VLLGLLPLLFPLQVLPVALVTVAEAEGVRFDDLGVTAAGSFVLLAFFAADSA